MRARTWILAAVMTFAFVWLTSQANWNFRSLANPLFHREERSVDSGKTASPPVGAPRASWSDPAAVRGAVLSPEEQNNIDIYKFAKLATVYITSMAVRRDFFYQPVASRSLGSGFLISEDGFILTNFHVISGSSRIQVTLSDQSQYNARAVDTDRSDDLALIKVTPKKRQTFLRLGDSDHLQVGQKVLAIGNPFGLEGTLTTGVVSSIGRAIQSEDNERLEGMIQTDAAINGGNSGGPLLDSGGNVIGISTAIVGRTNLGIGFAVPINRAKALLSDFQAGRVTERPKIGVTTEYVAGDLAETLGLPRRGGLLVQEVVRGSSEDVAGLRGARQIVAIGNVELGIGGDFIVAVDGQPVDREDALVRAMSQKRVGDTITLTIIRNGRNFSLPVRLLRAPPNEGL
ncbi:MAG: S1C family serine protease [Bryobacteraceae bacterium]|jgi:S1-C subfamily serine protease